MNKAVIMAGGFGTRLRPLTMTIPKPMVPLVNTPMVGHIVNLLKKHNFNDIISVLYFQPDKITSYFEDGSKFGVSMSYVHAKADYGTAGAVKNAFEQLGDRFLVISGDVLTDFDLTKALDFHIANKSQATLLLTRVATPLQYGIVMTDKGGRISRFLEKPSWGQVFSDTINTGIYILEPEVLGLIPYQEEFDFSKDLFPLMLEKKMPLFGYIADGYWRDVGNLNEYQAGQSDALKGKVRLEINGIRKGDVYIGENSTVATTAKLKGSVVIGNNVAIGEHSELSDVVIGDRSTIGDAAKISGTTIWDNTAIGDFAELIDDVVCNDCQIKSSATIAENVFISDGCTIGSNAELNSNIKLWPNKQVEDRATLSRSLVQEEKWLRELFSDARITGLSNIEINPEFGAKLGTAFGMTIGTNSQILASRDPDLVSRIIKRSISSGLSSVGVDINDLQTMSIPQTRQELMTGMYLAGFHVRRSPRVPGNTDIIIFSNDGRDIPISMTQKIERYFFGEDIKRAHYDSMGKIHFPARTNEIYVDRFLDSLNNDLIRNRKFKILMDYSFGLASTIFPFILGNMGVEALSLHDYVDAGRFHPDPHIEKPELDDTGKIMRSLGYELGFRLESGAEKISLIDERGVWYKPMRLLSIVTKLFLETHRHLEPYKIAVSIVANGEIEEIAKEYDVEIIRIRNSHSAMMEATRDKEIKFVGGAYGGYIFSDFLYATDGMFTVGKILEMLSSTKIIISQLDEQLPSKFQHLEEVPCPWDSKGTVMRKAMDHSSGHKRELVEGVKLFLGSGDSVLLLPAKEKGAFQVYGESTSREQAIAITRKYSILINRWKED